MHAREVAARSRNPAGAHQGHVNWAQPVWGDAQTQARQTQTLLGSTLTSNPIRRSAMATDTRKDTTADFNPFRDLTKTFEQFNKMPGVDMSSFVEARRKDVEALVAANKVTYEALQGLARTQTDMLTQAMQGMQESAKGVMAGGTSGAKSTDMTKHAEAAQKAWQKMLTDMKDLAEMVQKSQVEAMAGLTERAKENMGEITGSTHVK
jgi:phasin family protein